MERGRMVNKTTQTVTLLVDKNEFDSLKTELITVKRELMGFKHFMRATEVDLAELQQRFNEYDRNIVCRTVLKITQFIKRAFCYVRNTITAGKHDYTFLK